MRDEKIFVVYMATNIVNGHRYIGYSSDFKKRRIAHLGRARRNDSSGCAKFYNALRKYGEDAFSWRILATLKNHSEALAEEIRLIKKRKPEYNLSAGGEGNTGLAAWNRKPVTCLEDGRIFPSVRHAADFYGFHNVTVWEVCMTKNRSCRGMHFIFGNVSYGEKYRKRLIMNIERGCAERRKRRGNKKLVMPYRGVIGGKDTLGRSAAGPMKNARQVMCIDDGKVFPSANEAARHYDVCHSSLSQMCAGAVIKMKNGNSTKRKSVGGRKFKYIDQEVMH